MAFRTVPFEEYGAGSDGVWIILQRIGAVPRFFRGLLQFRVDGRIVFERCVNGRFVRIPALGKEDRHCKK